MSTIRQRTLKDGSTSYTAIVTRTIDGERYQETKTDAKKKLVATWAKNREREIDAEISAGRTPQKPNTRRQTLGDAIDRYVAEDRSGMGKTKKQVLETIRNEYEISSMPCDRITSADISNFANQLWDRPNVNSPATVNNYLQHLSAIFTVARPLWGFALDEMAMKDAMKALGKLGTRGKAKKRTRRPTLEELDRLMKYFHKASTHDPRAVLKQTKEVCDVLSQSLDKLSAYTETLEGEDCVHVAAPEADRGLLLAALELGRAAERGFCLKCGGVRHG